MNSIFTLIFNTSILRIALLYLCFISSENLCSQNLEKNFEEGLNHAKAGEYQAAINAFTRAIEVQPLDAYAWYNRGMAKNMIGEYLDAINDFGTCLGIQPTYVKARFNRGITKLYVAQYDGAVADFTNVVQVDREFSEAYYFRATVYELKGQYEFACVDYQNAREKGYKVPSEKLKACQDTSYQGLVHNPILFLQTETTQAKYGMKRKKSIKVGSKENMERYLRLLRAPDERFVFHEILATDSLVKVKISYSIRGKEKSKILYFDCNEQDQVFILKGFKTFPLAN